MRCSWNAPGICLGQGLWSNSTSQDGTHLQPSFSVLASIVYWKLWTDTWIMNPGVCVWGGAIGIGFPQFQNWVARGSHGGLGRDRGIQTGNYGRIPFLVIQQKLLHLQPQLFLCVRRVPVVGAVVHLYQCYMIPPSRFLCTLILNLVCRLLFGPLQLWTLQNNLVFCLHVLGVGFPDTWSSFVFLEAYPE